MESIKTAVENYAKQPEDPIVNFKLAREYHAIGQTAAALSHYLRAAERTNDKELSYVCLILIAECFDSQKNRSLSVRGAYRHAISLLPERPEAYFLLARLNERTNNFTECYMLSEVALNTCKFDLPPLQIDVGYPGRYGLLFEKAVASWWWGKVDECKKLFLDLKYNHNLDLAHLNAVNSNIQTLKVDESEYFSHRNKLNSSGKEKVDIVLQGMYTKKTDQLIAVYRKLNFVDKIIVSCWEDDEPSHVDYPEIQFIRNKKPSSPGTDNRNLQIVSSLNGVKLATRNYCVKMRTDQLYTEDSMKLMYDYYFSNNNLGQIFVAGLYPNLLFHPRDHLFWGTTEQLIKLFDIPLEQNGLIDRVHIPKDSLAKYYPHYTRTETYIGAHYASKFNEIVNMFLIYPQAYLYDSCVNWDMVHNLSKQMMPSLFKSFPRENINLYWISKDMQYPYDQQKEIYGECWAEEGY